MNQGVPDIGGRIEEILREYFIGTGYFVVRDIKLRYGGADVTDLDLWLYSRPSSLVRERVNVDARYKQTPKALERVLWARGVQAIIGAERCIVATSEMRPLAKEFGTRHGVLVLDGHFLGRLAKSAVASGAASRLAEEEFWDLFNPKNDKGFADWRARTTEAKSRLLDKLDFDGCNLWLDDASFFLTDGDAPTRRAVSRRLVYLSIAYFLVGLDHATRHLAFEDAHVRKVGVENGLRYGQAGRDGVVKNLRLAADLIEHYSPESRALGANLTRRALAEIDELPAAGLAELFSKSDMSTELFPLARELEHAAYVRQPPDPRTLTAKAQACVGAVLDFVRYDRNRFYEAPGPTGS